MTRLTRTALTALAIFGSLLAAAPGYGDQHQNKIWSIGLIHVGLEADGVFAVSQTIMVNFSMLIQQLADRAHLPVATHRKEWVEHGALFSYSQDFAPTGRLAARYIDKIFKGANPGDLAVEQPRELKLIISLKAAERFGVKIPPFILLRADEVVERDHVPWQYCCVCIEV